MDYNTITFQQVKFIIQKPNVATPLCYKRVYLKLDSSTVKAYNKHTFKLHITIHVMKI